jgi:predicted PhzF superfamily epimerase YddE/YHI9
LLDAADLDHSVRLAVAAQVGYSETAFVEVQGGDRQYRMRFFSALAEVHLSTGDDRVEVTGTAAPITSVGT